MEHGTYIVRRETGRYFFFTRMRKNASSKVKVVTVTIARKISLFEKVCPQCRKKFEGAKVRTYCSTVCANKAAYHRNPEAYRESRIRSYHKQKKERDNYSGSQP